jgi:hypothetical protein
MKRYEIYLKETDEILATGYNEFTALNNLVTCKNKYGNDTVAIRWFDTNLERKDYGRIS